MIPASRRKETMPNKISSWSLILVEVVKIRKRL